MQPKLIINFKPFSEPAFLTKGELINTSLAANTNFPLPWPTNVPTPTQLNTAFLTYQTAYNAAVNGDSSKITVRKDARRVLTVILKTIAPYLEIVAAGSVAILQTTGYDLRHDATIPVTPPDLSAPVNFTLEHGKLGGVVIGRASALPGAGSYEVQKTTADPTVEANWLPGGIYRHCSRMELAGLTPGTKCSFRIRGIGSNGPGAWTPAVSIMVI